MKRTWHLTTFRQERDAGQSGCLDGVFPAIPCCVDLIERPYLKTDQAFVKGNRSFRTGLPHRLTTA
jgi:hypothetical protein